MLCKSDTREIAGKVREFGPEWEKLSSERSTKVTPTEVLAAELPLDLCA